jgi:hypothetical protein
MIDSIFILIIATVIGALVADKGNILKKKDEAQKLEDKKKGYKINWTAFGITLFVLLGGLDFIFESHGQFTEFIGNVFLFALHMIIVVGLIYAGLEVHKYIQKKRQGNNPEPPAAPPTPPAV